MIDIAKISDITPEALADYIILDDADEGDLRELNNYFRSAVAYMQNYTGRTVAEMDKSADFVIVALTLVQDMWDNRTLHITDDVNPTIETILNMHRSNLLPKEDDNG